MPTPNGITLCPFFDREGRQSLSCEDTIRRFKDEPSKLEHKRIYCDADWKSCPHARALGAAYEREEQGDIHAVTEFKLEARRHEIIKLLQTSTRLERKVAARDAEIAKLRGKCHDLEKEVERKDGINRTLQSVKRRLTKELSKLRGDVFAEVQAIAQFYESRLSYMMDTYSGGMLNETDVEAWAKDREFKIVSSKDDDGRITWSLLFKEEEHEE